MGHKEARHLTGLSVKHSVGSSESLQSVDPRMLSADKQARQAFNKVRHCYLVVVFFYNIANSSCLPL